MALKLISYILDMLHIHLKCVWAMCPFIQSKTPPPSVMSTYVGNFCTL